MSVTSSENRVESPCVATTLWNNRVLKKKNLLKTRGVYCPVLWQDFTVTDANSSVL